MRIRTIPTINDELFSFKLRFIGRDDVRPGTRHFLEHMLFNTNGKYSGEEFRKKLSEVGAEDCFSACTSQDEIYLGGTYLKKDAKQIAELLNLALNNLSFTEADIEKERMIILEEIMMRKDDMINQAWFSISKELNYDFTMTGFEDDVKKIDKVQLKTVYEDIITDANVDLTVHNCDTFLEHLRIPDWGLESDIVQPVFQEQLLIENENMSSNLVMLLFDHKADVKASFLSQYLSHFSGPLFNNIREKKQMCYMVGATDRWMTYSTAPYFSVYAGTTHHPALMIKELLDNMVVDDEIIYKSIRKSCEKELAEAKTNIWLRMNLQEQASRWRVPYEALPEMIPTFEDLVSFCEEVKSKYMSNIVVVGTKKD